jgi:hypothetical protein
MPKWMKVPEIPARDTLFIKGKVSTQYEVFRPKMILCWYLCPIPTLLESTHCSTASKRTRLLKLRLCQWRRCNNAWHKFEFKSCGLIMIRSIVVHSTFLLTPFSSIRVLCNSRHSRRHLVLFLIMIQNKILARGCK